MKTQLVVQEETELVRNLRNILKSSNPIKVKMLEVGHTFSNRGVIETIFESYGKCSLSLTDSQTVKIVLNDGTFLYRGLTHIVSVSF